MEIKINRDATDIQNEYAQICAHIGDLEVQRRKVDSKINEAMKRVDELAEEFKASKEAEVTNGASTEQQSSS